MTDPPTNSDSFLTLRTLAAVALALAFGVSLIAGRWPLAAMFGAVFVVVVGR
jgi:hypothetical protein